MSLDDTSSRDPAAERAAWASSDGAAASAPRDARQALLDLALGAARLPEPGTDAGIEPLARDLLDQLDPRGPAETMLAVQMVATFVRSMFLARFANRQKHPRWFALYSTECDRSMNLYRKQMKALDEHRNPRSPSFTAIRHANIAGQQVVVTGGPAPDAADPSGRKVAHARLPLPAGAVTEAAPPVPPDPSR